MDKRKKVCRETIAEKREKKRKLTTTAAKKKNSEMKFVKRRRFSRSSGKTKAAESG